MWLLLKIEGGKVGERSERVGGEREEGVYID